MLLKDTLSIRDLPSFYQSVAFVKKHEGLRLKVYTCPGGVKTVGYGHALIRDDCVVGDSITEQMAEILLKADLIKAYQSLFRLISVPLTDNQQTALVSLIFNIGSGQFQSSTLRMKLNRGEYKDAAAEFERWNKSKGTVLRGLQIRRREENRLFLDKDLLIDGAQRSFPAFKPTMVKLPYHLPVNSFWKKAATFMIGAFR